MAKSSRVKRRAMARSRSVRRGGFSGFYVACGAIVVVGLLLVIVSRKSNSAGAVGPYLNTDSTPHSQADEHWHSAVGVNICGTWEPGPIWTTTTSGGQLARKGTNIYAGLHTHQLSSGQSDGLIHMEPSTVDEAGKNATFGKWLEYGGWQLSGSSMNLWPGADGKTIKWSNGDTCPSGPYKGQKGVVRWALGTHKSGTTTKLVEQTRSLPKYKLYDQDVIAVYFLPKSVKLTGDLLNVPSETNLATPSAGEGPGHTNLTTTTTPGSTSSTPTTKATGTTATTVAGSPTTVSGGGSTTTAPASTSSSSPPTT